MLRQFSALCGAKRPEAIRSTKLRKHVATVTQIMNMQDNELDILANFMGHDIRVHREFYRMPDEVVQVAKVSKFLLAVERGELTKYQGKGLDDIPLPEEELEGEFLECFTLRYGMCAGVKPALGSIQYGLSMLSLFHINYHVYT